jgi:multidrug efflux pump subunit AcrA (membrane-fusion protein)
MENKRNQNWKIARIAVLAMATGLALGVFLHPRPAGTNSAALAEEERSAKSEPSPEVVQITPESQKDVGIIIEAAGFRALRETLSATGTVSEDPVRVAHIRPLARGIIEKTYIRLGDRVSKGDPLIEYDNVELGLALGEYQVAQTELQRSLTDLEVKKKILDRGKKMLKVGAIARTAYDLREAECKDAEAKTVGARSSMANLQSP